MESLRRTCCSAKNTTSWVLEVCSPPSIEDEFCSTMSSMSSFRTSWAIEQINQIGHVGLLDKGDEPGSWAARIEVWEQKLFCLAVLMAITIV